MVFETRLNNATNARNADAQLANEYDNYIELLKESKTKRDDVRDAIREYDEVINKLENTEKKRFLSLMATRNMMNGQGGYVKNYDPASLFLASQKKIQERFDNNADALKQDYINRYWDGQGA